MGTLLTASLELRADRPVLGDPIWVRMIMVNGFDRDVVIVNPDVGVPPPELDWKASIEAYQISVLMSFGLTRILLKDADGRLVESKGLMPWVTPILGKRTLQPHDKLVLNFDLNELFVIDLAGLYNVWLRYGDKDVYAEVNMDVEIRQRTNG